MGNLSARLFGTHYLVKVRHDASVLHYKRAPTWRSLALFAGEEVEIMLCVVNWANSHSKLLHITCVASVLCVQPTMSHAFSSSFRQLCVR